MKRITNPVLMLVLCVGSLWPHARTAASLSESSVPSVEFSDYSYSVTEGEREAIVTLVRRGATKTALAIGFQVGTTRDFKNFKQRDDGDMMLQPIGFGRKISSLVV